jgi:hypothetical protein
MAIYNFSNSQNVSSDTSQTLGEVIVKAYEQNQSLRKVPAAINKVNKAVLNDSAIQTFFRHLIVHRE